MSVNPGTCGGAIGSHWSYHVVRDCEEEGDVCVEEASDYGRVGFFETEGS